MPSLLTVTPEEDGIKLLRFLERRLEECPPSAALHRWVRTGQVRVNAGRAKAFCLLRAGDAVRVPPFARARPVQDEPEKIPSLGEDLPILGVTPEILVLCKPAGLPVQPGTGHRDSVVRRLCAAFAGQPVIPAPVHRIDRHTSGLLLVGRTQAALRHLHGLFVHPGGIGKEYLAWVAGSWPHAMPLLLLDTLEKMRDPDGLEYVRRRGNSHDIPLAGEDIAQLPAVLSEGANARCVVVPLRHLPDRRATLLRIHLLTGRTHQIRVQLAGRAFPVIGDGRYGGPTHNGMLLHAAALTLPGGERYAASPPWTGCFAVTALPAA